MSDEARLLESLRESGAPDPERFRAFVASWLGRSSDLDREIAFATYNPEDDSALIFVDYNWQFFESDRGNVSGMHSPYFGVMIFGKK